MKINFKDLIIFCLYLPLQLLLDLQAFLPPTLS